MTDEDGLAREVRRLAVRVSHWTPSRWAASAASGPATRADTMHALVQELADLCAEAERVPRRRVPRLDNDGALPDQLRVITADLAAVAPPAVLDLAARRVAETRSAL